MGARRELREEAGIVVAPSQLIALGEVLSGDKINLLYGLAVDTEIKPRLNHESDSYRWMQPPEIAASQLLHHATRTSWPHCERWLATLATEPAAPGLPTLTAWQRVRHLFEPTRTAPVLRERR